MLVNYLLVLAILPACIVARPTPHDSVVKRCSVRSVASIAHASATVALPASPTYSAATTSSSQISTTNSSHISTESSAAASHTRSSTSPSASSSPLIPTGSKSTGLISSLFPNGQGNNMWSTAVGAVNGAVALTLNALNPFAVLQSAAPKIGNAPDGSSAIHVNYPKGSYDFKGPEGGISFYSKTGIDLSNAKEVTSSYSVMFSEDFQFNLGGKLPGLYGGDNPSTDIGCSGGRRDKGCFSVRYMWREDGKGELYTYLPQPSMGSQFSGNQQLCHVKPLSDCNDAFGASVGRGSWFFKPGAWTTLSQRVKLNDAGQQNGELEVIVNGQTMFSLNGLAYRDSDKGRIDGYIFQSFFGGHETEWASPKNQDVFFKDFSIAITENL